MPEDSGLKETALSRGFKTTTIPQDQIFYLEEKFTLEWGNLDWFFLLEDVTRHISRSSQEERRTKKIWNLPPSIWRHKFIRMGTLTESHLSSAFLPSLASRCSKEIVLWEIFTGDPILVYLCSHLMVHAHTWTYVIIIFFWEYA